MMTDGESAGGILFGTFKRISLEQHPGNIEITNTRTHFPRRSELGSKKFGMTVLLDDAPCETHLELSERNIITLDMFPGGTSKLHPTPYVGNCRLVEAASGPL
ncbi:hypothetical protein EVAR_13023_1 [Eumeta japonica]|uniref:Uncharacterized protein n=1 Tax=Eumeta variegata TaxID=151549 RepID=A0A4C1TX11_EUMVA|nr:hypothetical protein EVAR_13023_1 [Eumeta japonica]